MIESDRILRRWLLTRKRIHSHLLQIFCDVLVKELTRRSSDLPMQTVYMEEKEQRPEADPNAAVIQSIEAQSKRIDTLYKQISETICSLKPLLKL